MSCIKDEVLKNTLLQCDESGSKNIKEVGMIHDLGSRVSHWVKL